MMMNSMLAYPGRATLQVYQRLVQRNELAEGKIRQQLGSEEDSRLMDNFTGQLGKLR